MQPKPETEAQPFVVQITISADALSDLRQELIVRHICGAMDASVMERLAVQVVAAGEAGIAKVFLERWE